MKHKKRAPVLLSAQEMQQLRIKSAVCVLCAIAFVVVGVEPGSSLNTLLSKAAVPLAAYFRYDVDAAMVALGVAIVWLAAGTIFWGQWDEASTDAKAEAARDEKSRQQLEFEAELARVEAFSETERRS